MAISLPWKLGGAWRWPAGGISLPLYQHGAICGMRHTQRTAADASLAQQAVSIACIVYQTLLAA